MVTLNEPLIICNISLIRQNCEEPSQAVHKNIDYSFHVISIQLTFLQQLDLKYRIINVENETSLHDLPPLVGYSKVLVSDKTVMYLHVYSLIWKSWLTLQKYWRFYVDEKSTKSTLPFVTFSLWYDRLLNQECIPVGCVPPARRPYLPGPGGSRVYLGPRGRV